MATGSGFSDTPTGDAVTRAGVKFVGYEHAPAWSPGQPATGIKFLLKFLFGVFTAGGMGRTCAPNSPGNRSTSRWWTR